MLTHPLSQGFEGMFHAWLANSMNHSIADEIFVAYDAAKSNSIIGFITLKRKELNVNIGLLSVAASHRRMGIGTQNDTFRFCTQTK